MSKLKKNIDDLIYILFAWAIGLGVSAALDRHIKAKATHQPPPAYEADAGVAE